MARTKNRRDLPVDDPQATVYEDWSQGAAGDAEFDEEDETVTADDGDGTEQHAGTAHWRSRRKDAQAAERARRHEEQREADRARNELPSADLSSDEALLQMRSRIREASERYAEQMRMTDLFGKEIPVGAQAAEIDHQHAAYLKMMKMSLVAPLAKGVNANSIVQSVGMMTAMMCLSRDFRSDVGDAAEKIPGLGKGVHAMRDAVQKNIDRRAEAAGETAEKKADRQNRRVELGTKVREFITPDKKDDQQWLSERAQKKAGRDDYLSKKWSRRLNDLETRERGGRDLFTPESAALTQVGIMESAYRRMHEKGVDPDQVMGEFSRLRSTLFTQMEDDGLDRADVNHQMRIVIGRRMEHDPQVRLMYKDLAHGAVLKAPERETKAADGSARLSWTGEFQDHMGKAIPDDVPFELRPPMRAAQHQAAMEEQMTYTMAHAVNRMREGDPSQMSSMTGYLYGFSDRERPGRVRDLAPNAQDRFAQAQVMQDAMDADRIPVKAQRTAYATAFANAYANVAEQEPEFEQMLQAGLGTDWRRRLEDSIDAPDAFQQGVEDRARKAADEQQRRMREEWSRANRFQAGPDGTSSQYRDTYGNNDNDYQPV